MNEDDQALIFVGVLALVSDVLIYFDIISKTYGIFKLPLMIPIALILNYGVIKTLVQKVATKTEVEQ